MASFLLSTSGSRKALKKQEVEDEIFHTDRPPVGELQSIRGVLNLGSEDMTFTVWEPYLITGSD